jgi:hypothetical protein
MAALWELLPYEPQARVWRFTKYTGRVVVRAENEEHARRLASLTFQASSSYGNSGGAIGDPWDSPLLVECKRLSGKRRQWLDGPEEVVFPPLSLSRFQIPTSKDRQIGPALGAPQTLALPGSDQTSP